VCEKVVTGGNKGVGLATVRGLAKVFEGKVYLTARDQQRGQEAVAKLDQQGVKVGFHLLDIDDESSIERLRAYLADNYGGIDVLVNNAGIAFKNNATEPMSVQAKRTIQTNYFSVKNTCDKLFPLLRNGARVVNVSSSSGFLPNIPGEHLRNEFARSDSTLTVNELSKLMNDFIICTEQGNHTENGWPSSTYVVSKVGLSALTRIQQREMDKIEDRKDIVINHVHPGWVDTDMSSHKGPLTPDQGAKSSIFAATLPIGTDVRGCYIWSECQIVDWVNGPKP